MMSFIINLREYFKETKESEFIKNITSEETLNKYILKNK